MNGKGDTRRNRQVTQKEYSDNWDKIFNKKKVKNGRKTANNDK